MARKTYGRYSQPIPNLPVQLVDSR